MNLYLKLNLTPFASIFSYIYTCGAGSVFGIRIRIQELLNTDPIRIRIHNTACLSIKTVT